MIHFEPHTPSNYFHNLLSQLASNIYIQKRKHLIYSKGGNKYFSKTYFNKKLVNKNVLFDNALLVRYLEKCIVMIVSN